ncbi:MAG: hypothetical protein AUG51_00160 [Acidobacteria bacterium 13_1_20CM_3_53_8]|nr:MAG: hypothetical protein AUG51_00160 [Acidobacteria bacterium 13_1_20CM_3_53_8]
MAGGGSLPPAAAAGGGSQLKSTKPKSTASNFQSRASAVEVEKNAVNDVQAFSEEPPFGGVGGTTQRPPLTLVQKTPAPPQNSSSAFTEEAPFDFSTEPEDAVGTSAPVMAASSNDSFVEKLKAALEKRRRMFLAVAIEGARRSALEEDELYVEFAPGAKHLRDTLSKPDSIKTLREACRELLGRDVSVRIVVKEVGAGDDHAISKQEAEAREKQRLREIAEKNPMVQEMLRTFRGEIVDVRRIDEQ